MARFIHSVLAQNESVTAGTTISYDLPVNPLSFVLFTLRFSQNLADTQLNLNNARLMVSKLEVLFKGSPVFTANGIDITAMNAMVMGFQPWLGNSDGEDNDLLYLPMLIPMGRFPWKPDECFPRSTRGELILQVTYAATFADIDAVTAQIETVELPEASPSRYLRMTTLSVTPTATGELDVELPIGNPIPGVLFFGTTIPTNATSTKTLVYVQILLDNERRFYSQTNHESWRQLAAMKHAPPYAQGLHTHQTDGAIYAQYADTSAAKYAEDWVANHLYLDFDVLNDGLYLLETSGLNNIVARINAGDTNALRVLPLELVGV